jgi:hypothetical protein
MAIIPPLIWGGWPVYYAFAMEVARIVIGGEVEPVQLPDADLEMPPAADEPLLSLPTEEEWKDIVRRRQAAKQRQP